MRRQGHWEFILQGSESETNEYLIQRWRPGIKWSFFDCNSLSSPPPPHDFSKYTVRFHTSGLWAVAHCTWTGPWSPPDMPHFIFKWPNPYSSFKTLLWCPSQPWSLSGPLFPAPLLRWDSEFLVSQGYISILVTHILIGTTLCPLSLLKSGSPGNCRSLGNCRWMFLVDVFLMVSIGETFWLTSFAFDSNLIIV